MTSSGAEYDKFIERSRQSEYPMLKDAVYLDHAGCTLYPKSLIEAYSADLLSSLLANPHSASSSSHLTSSRVDDARLGILRFFRASPQDFDIVFVSNATAGIKLVMEAFRGSVHGFDYMYHQDSHTSLIGVRESARCSHCLDDDAVERWLLGNWTTTNEQIRQLSARNVLFAYPAQSNFTGRRLPLAWLQKAKALLDTGRERVYTLLDAAAMAPTSPLNLSDVSRSADFTVVSFAKIFGFPDLGALIVKKPCYAIFKARKYFGGGTVDLVTCAPESTHAVKSQAIHDGLEDGTLPYHSIIALDHAMVTHKKLFGSMEQVAKHTSFIAKQLRDNLTELQHGNAEPLCQMYSSGSTMADFEQHQGPIIAFNLKDCNGSWISNTDVERLATVHNFHIRTGGLCNPGGIAASLGLEPWELEQNYRAGYRCGAETDILHDKPTGAIRVSLGAMSTLGDVGKFISFLSTAYLQDEPVSRPEPDHSNRKPNQPRPSLNFIVQRLMIYPVKSCGGMNIADFTPWEIKPEGLMWDRAWCIVHEGTGQALSQKKYPCMALIKPVLDIEAGLLRIRYLGARQLGIAGEVSVPLALGPTFTLSSSLVCEATVSLLRYSDPHISSFFTTILGTSCTLARFPAGSSSRRSKDQTIMDRTTRHRVDIRNLTVPGAFHGSVNGTSPSHRTSKTLMTPISLSNESPILLINASSVSALNKEIIQTRGKEIQASVFRANIIIAPNPSPTPCPTTTSPSYPAPFKKQHDNEHQAGPYVEERWKTIRIGNATYEMLGKCHRCNMICVDQETGAVHREPLSTLSKTRGLWFGMHAKCLSSDITARQREGKKEIEEGEGEVVEEVTKVMIRVGDVVSVEEEWHE